MTHKEFEQLVREFQEREQKIFHWKSEEYANGEDKLLNFKEIAAFLEQTPSKVCFEFLMKHIQSIKLTVMNERVQGKWDWEIEGGEGLKQRIVDARNYLLLLAACLEEEAQKSTPKKFKFSWATAEDHGL